jgi:phosphoserine aminotransferase
MLPEEVLAKAAQEMLDYKGTGQSVMEMSHRSAEYEDIINGAEATVREVMGIPANYKVLFLQGGASSQFAMIPLNLFHKSKRCDIVDTGTWALKAISEAKRYGTVNVVATSKDDKYRSIPALDPSKFDKDADYFHITTNNTIEGTVFSALPTPETFRSSATCPQTFSPNRMTSANSDSSTPARRKNLGPAGLTLVIIRDDLIGHALDFTPTMFNYKTHADNGSMYNTPRPTRCISRSSSSNTSRLSAALKRFTRPTSRKPTCFTTSSTARSSSRRLSRKETTVRS